MNDDKPVDYYQLKDFQEIYNNILKHGQKIKKYFIFNIKGIDNLSIDFENGPRVVVLGCEYKDLYPSNK